MYIAGVVNFWLVILQYFKRKTELKWRVLEEAEEGRRVSQNKVLSAAFWVGNLL